jgi:VWFA-related protein
MLRAAIANLALVFAALWLASSACAQAPEGPQTPAPGVPIQKAPEKIKVHTLLVNTPVTVTDPQGQLVNTLEKSDFHVTDNGAPQTITHFTLGGDPISLVVVVETSERLSALLPQIRKTGILLSQTVTGPSGEAAVIGYDDDVKVLQNFTNSADALEKTMSQLMEGYNGAKLFDAMSKAVELLSSRPEVSATNEGKRRVMLVIGEGHDSGSEDKLGEVLRRAQLANITIYTVGISGFRSELAKKSNPQPTPQATPDGIFGMPGPPGTVQTPTGPSVGSSVTVSVSNLIGVAQWVVTHTKAKVTSQQLAIASTATGGAHISTWKNESIQNAIDEIGAELHSEYTLSYTPQDQEQEGYHEIKVTVDRKDLTVRARPGYYLEPPKS